MSVSVFLVCPGMSGTLGYATHPKATTAIPMPCGRDDFLVCLKRGNMPWLSTDKRPSSLPAESSRSKGLFLT